MPPINTNETLLRSYRYMASCGYNLPEALVSTWIACGPHFQREHDIETDDGAESLIYWWIIGGHLEFPGISDLITQHIAMGLHLNIEFVKNGHLKLTPLLRIIQKYRSDLDNFSSDSFNLESNIWEWWFVYGKSEYSTLYQWLESKQTYKFITETLNDLSGFEGQAIGLALTLLGQLKDDDTDLATDRYRAQLRHLFQKLHFDHIGELGQGSESLTPLMALIHSNRPDLRAAFDLDTVEGRSHFWNWWTTFRITEYPIEDISPIAIRSDTSPSKNTSPSIHAVEERPSAETTFNSLRGNISLVGYPRGEFGLGEDIRLLRNSLQTAGIEPNIIKAPWQIIARQTINEQAEEADVADFNSDVIVYVMPAFDTLTLLNKVGPRAFSARHKIGYWQWELDKFPEPAKIAFDLIDEIWCHSEHSARAFRSATDKPVTKVPLPVLVPEIRKVPRSTFGMDDDSFIIFTSFDGASSISRKNPMGVILAFQQAFPRKEFPHAKLIVKAMNTIEDALWRDCLRKAAIDHRIEILNKVLDRSEYYELLRCCDAVLSLHRAEGFGRLMAEAMAIGIPVIATAYSGNLDFMTEQNSWLVPGELSPLIPGDYPFHQGQEWMEPDIDKAAEALRDCYDNPDKRKRLVANAKVTIERYSPANCGKLYAELLAARRT